MIYPSNFETKIGFEQIRTLLKGFCLSRLGTEWVDNAVKFRTRHAQILQSLGEISEFQRFEEEEVDAYEPNFFDCRESLLRVRPERTYLEEQALFDLCRSLQCIESLVSFFLHTGEENEAGDFIPKYPYLKAMGEDIFTSKDIILRISNILNKFGKIKDTASPTLAAIRRELEQTSRSISASLRSILHKAQAEGVVEKDVHPTMRDGRLVIPVNPSLKRKIHGIVHDESTSGKTIFIEPTAVVEANNRIRELEAEEKREIIRILQEITAVIRPQIPEILRAFHFLAHIDFLRAATALSKSFNSIHPTITDRPCLHFVQATHPLLERSLRQHGRKMNKLDICIDGEQRLIVISGPNAGGKSVCLKTVGLLQYMLQCGLPIPVGEGSTVGIFDRIFIDIGDEQNLEDDLSTYSSHLLNMKEMMRGATEKSLLLIDEFGGGTEPLVGGALAEAILLNFVKINAWGIITTHYQNLKRIAETHPSVVNGAMLYDRGEMRPLFRLQIGQPGSSFAVEIARKIGIPNDVIDYAANIVGQDYILSEKYLQDIVRDKVYWERKRQNVHKREKQLEEIVEKYNQEMRQLSSERKEILSRAKADAEQLLKESNAQIENTIRSIKESQAEKEKTLQARKELEEFKDKTSELLNEEDQRIASKLAKILRRQERKKEGKSNKAKPAATPASSPASSSKPSRTTVPLQAGDTVRIKGQDTVGKVESINGKQARVLFGMMYTNVDLKRLQPAEAPRENKLTQDATFISKSTRDAIYEKKLNFRPEIDLRGMRAEEALSAVSYYIDDALTLSYPQVRILHGTGTGALRGVVRQYLGSVPGVKRFHDEHVQFGGAGITVVEFS